MAEFISDYFGKDFDAVGVFDAVMDSDSHYFINVTRLKDTTTPEFLESYSKINSYFHEIALLLLFARKLMTWSDWSGKNILRTKKSPTSKTLFL